MAAVEEADILVPTFPVIFRHHDSLPDADLAQNQTDEQAPDEITPAIFVKDPEGWIRYVDKVVRIETDNGGVVEGVVHVIDPVSEAVVIARWIDGWDRTGVVSETDGIKRTASNALTKSNEEDDVKMDCKSSLSKLSVEIIPGHIVKGISFVSEADPLILKDLDRLFGENDSAKSGATLTEETLERKRDDVKNWLTANRIPVEIGGLKGDVIQVAGKALIIKPPYDVEHCFSLNEIILKKVQQLLRNRKEDDASDDS